MAKTSRVFDGISAHICQKWQVFTHISTNLGKVFYWLRCCVGLCFKRRYCSIVLCSSSSDEVSLLRMLDATDRENQAGSVPYLTSGAGLHTKIQSRILIPTSRGGLESAGTGNAAAWWRCPQHDADDGGLVNFDGGLVNCQHVGQDKAERAADSSCCSFKHDVYGEMVKEFHLLRQ